MVSCAKKENVPHMMCIHMLAWMRIEDIGLRPAHMAMMFISVNIRLGRHLCVDTFINITGYV